MWVLLSLVPLASRDETTVFKSMKVQKCQAFKRALGFRMNDSWNKETGKVFLLVQITVL